jgi:hypothetical protein
MLSEAEVRPVVAMADRQRHLFRPIYDMASLGQILSEGFDAIRRDLREASSYEQACVCATFAMVRSSTVHVDHVFEAGRAITAEIDDPTLARRRVVWLLIAAAPFRSSDVQNEIQESGATELFVMSTNNPDSSPRLEEIDVPIPVKIVPLDAIASMPAALFYDAFCDEYAYSIVQPRAKAGIKLALERLGYSHYQMLNDASKVRLWVPRELPPITAHV